MRRPRIADGILGLYRDANSANDKIVSTESRPLPVTNFDRGGQPHETVLHNIGPHLVGVMLPNVPQVDMLPAQATSFPNCYDRLLRKFDVPE